PGPRSPARADRASRREWSCTYGSAARRPPCRGWRRCRSQGAPPGRRRVVRRWWSWQFWLRLDARSRGALRIVGALDADVALRLLRPKASTESSRGVERSHPRRPDARRGGGGGWSDTPGRGAAHRAAGRRSARRVEMAKGHMAHGKWGGG